MILLFFNTTQLFCLIFLEKKLKGVLSNPSQLLTMRALRKQQKTGQAHIVLSRKT
jgi:hypothetical protein